MGSATPDPGDDSAWCPDCDAHTGHSIPECPEHGRIHTCEDCGEIFTGEHHSTPDCNETGLRVTLCEACAAWGDMKAEAEQ